MKILWLYQYAKDYDYDNWLHLKFADSLRVHPGLKVLCYGPGIHASYPKLTTLPYDKRITISDIYSHFNFDVIIMNTKSRMFGYYSPHSGIAKDCWIPDGTSRFDTKRIVIEEDYHYETDDKWYQEERIDLILQRHYSQSLRQEVVPMGWLPFSVDTGTFRPPVHSGKRIRKDCFAGTSNDDAYRIRSNACKMLEHEGLVKVFPNRSVVGPAYVKCLQSYIAHISCSSTYRLSTAKMFEIMASGSVLLTNDNDDLLRLFPEGSFCRYQEDMSDIVDIAKGLIANPAMTAKIAMVGRHTILERHSHQTRIKELIDIIKGGENPYSPSAQ